MSTKKQRREAAKKAARTRAIRREFQATEWALVLDGRMWTRDFGRIHASLHKLADNTWEAMAWWMGPGRIRVSAHGREDERIFTDEEVDQGKAYAEGLAAELRAWLKVRVPQ